jgi:hypothetical protein
MDLNVYMCVCVSVNMRDPLNLLHFMQIYEQSANHNNNNKKVGALLANAHFIYLYNNNVYNSNILRKNIFFILRISKFAAKLNLSH